MLDQLFGCSTVAIATYYFASFIQTVFHRIFGHTRRIGAVYDVHVGGHHARYQGKLLTAKWIPSERHVMWYYAIPFGPMLVVAFVLLSRISFAIHTAALAWTIWWHIYLHKHYHLHGSWFVRFEWFRKKRALHFIHHRSDQKNFAIVEYVWDRLLGTYQSKGVSRRL
jgi:hypothetical protein